MSGNNNNNAQAGPKPNARKRGGKPPNQAINNNNKQQNSKKQMKAIIKQATVPRVMPMSKDTHRFNKSQVTALVRAMVNQDKMFVFPRHVPSPTYPLMLKWTRPILVSSNKISSGFGQMAVLQTNVPEKYLSIGHWSDTTSITAWQGSVQTQREKNTQVESGTNISLPLPFEDTTGRRYVPAEVPGAVGILRVNHNITAPGVATNINAAPAAPSRWLFTVDNEAGVSMGNVTITLVCYSGTAEEITVVDTCTLTQAVAPNTAVGFSMTGVGNWSTWWANFALGTTTYVGAYWSSSVDTNMQNFGITLDYTTFDADFGWIWNDFTLWDLLPRASSSTIQKLYNESKNYSTTGGKILFRNTTVLSYRGGSEFAATLPGVYDLETYKQYNNTLVEIIKVQKSRNLIDNDLTLGADVISQPEKVQDFFYVNPSSARDLPVNALYMDPGTALNSVFQMEINGSISLEFLTPDPAYNKIMPQGSGPLCDAVIASLAQANTWSHNPNHIQKAARVVKEVIGNPHVKSVLHSLSSAAIKLAPMVLDVLAV